MIRQSSFVVLLAGLLGWSEVGRADLIIDQQNLSATMTTSMRSTANQSFTPTLTGLNYATLRIALMSTNPVVPLDFVAVIRAGDGPTGAVLGTSSVVTVISTTLSDVAFSFADTIALIPGQIYTLQVQAPTINTIFLAGFSNNSAYAGGVGYFGTQPRNGVDLAFSEGLQTAAVPEPSSLLLCGLAGASTWAGLRARRSGRAPRRVA